METMTVVIKDVPKDCTGRVLQAGDLVAVARRCGSNSWQGRYKVLRIDDEKGAVFQKYDDATLATSGRAFYYKAGQQAVIVTESADSDLTDSQIAGDAHE